MKAQLLATSIGVIAFVIGGQTSAWTGDKWATLSRSSIQTIAQGMIDVPWTPKNTIKNLELTGRYFSFKKGTTYGGVAYSQENPQESKTEFLGAVKNTAGGTTAYGNDCSGFASMAWKLPARLATVDFEKDATSEGGRVTCIGSIGNGQYANLQLGDALVRSSDHLVLVKSVTTGGVKTMEQTPHTARNKDWSWSQLASYRPIRRNALSEDAKPFFCETPLLNGYLTLYNESYHKAYFSGNARDDKGLTKIEMVVKGPKGTVTAFSVPVSGANKALTSYAFDAWNKKYAGRVGNYSVVLKLTDSTGQSQTSPVFNVYVRGYCEWGLAMGRPQCCQEPRTCDDWGNPIP